MKKGSEDIRSLAVRNVFAGKYSVAQVAEMNGYCISTIYNWISIYIVNVIIFCDIGSSYLPKSRRATRAVHTAPNVRFFLTFTIELGVLFAWEKNAPDVQGQGFF